MEFFAEHKQLLLYLSIPITSGFIGWFTNWVALKMTFYPLTFWGIPPYLGWQGIIPRKAAKMSAKAVDMLTTRILRVEEIFKKADPDEMAKEMTPPVKEATRELVEELGHSSNPALWNLIPQAMKDGMIGQINGQVPSLVKRVLQDIKLNILSVFDIKTHVISQLTGSNVHKLVDLFQRAGGPEFRFIELSGLYIGFLMGCMQMAVWVFYAKAWMLPVIGVIVGYLTNWIALKMIFRPLYEKKYLFIRYQGLFLRRQKEVSKEYAHFYATEILSPEKVMDAILYGKTADQLMQIAQHNIIQAMSIFEGLAKPVASLLIGSAEYDNIRQFILHRLTAVIPKSARRMEGYLGRAMDLENLLYERMSKLPPEEFENLLRSAFQEDEIILIMVGAVLGFIVGLGQVFIFTG